MDGEERVEGIEEQEEQEEEKNKNDYGEGKVEDEDEDEVFSSDPPEQLPLVYKAEGAAAVAEVQHRR